jgi:hypothetical protein
MKWMVCWISKNPSVNFSRNGFGNKSIRLARFHQRLKIPG